MRLNLIIALFSLAGAIPVYSQADEELAFPEVRGWELDVAEAVYTPDNLWDLINGGAESYLAYDFIDLHLADYVSQSGLTVHVELYRHTSLNNAFGIYSIERSPEYNFLEIGGQAYMDEGILNAYSGPFYLKIYTTDEDPALQEAMQTIAKAIVKELKYGRIKPGLLGIFPDTGKLPNSEEYIAHNFLGLEFLHFAFRAYYEEGYSLFVIEGKDPGEALKMASAYLEFTRQDIDPASNQSFVIEDRYNGDIPVFISDEYLIGIQGDAGTEALQAVLADFVRRLGAME